MPFELECQPDERHPHGLHTSERRPDLDDLWRIRHLQRGVEQPSTYLLLVEWNSVEDHVQGFRESELFVRWRELIGSYFAAPPEVELEDVTNG